MGQRGSPQGPLLFPMSPSTTIHATGPVYLLDASAAAQLWGRQRRLGGWARSATRLRLALAATLLAATLLAFFAPHVAAALSARSRQAAASARDLDFPVRACCIGQQCVRNSLGRHAVVTHVRSEREVTQLQQLEASLRRSSPGVDLAVMLARGQLGSAAAQRVMDLGATLIYVEPLGRQYGGGARPGSRSWLRLRAFGLTQYDAVLLVDSTAYITGDVTPLFSLPTDFAADWDQARWLGGNGTAPHAVSGGALFLRPCAATEARMLSLLAAGGKAGGGGQRGALPGAAAAGEQQFLAWYFQLPSATLPFDAYVISMPGAADRLASFQRSFEASDLAGKQLARWPAVDGGALDAARLVAPRALEDIGEAEAAGFRTKHYQLTRGSLGCYLSHLQLWHHVLRETEAQFAFVFEDDAVLAPGLLAALVDAKPFPDDWDFVLLGHYCHACPRLPGAPAYRAAHAFFGTHAYVAHRRGLQKVFGYPRLMPIEKQIDAVLGDMCRQGALNVYALDPPLVQQDSARFASTIQLPVKRQLGVNPYARD